jgi:hypothetical protein
MRVDEVAGNICPALPPSAASGTQGQSDIARHVINTCFEPSFLEMDGTPLRGAQHPIAWCAISAMSYQHPDKAGHEVDLGGGIARGAHEGGAAQGGEVGKGGRRREAVGLQGDAGDGYPPVGSKPNMPALPLA